MRTLVIFSLALLTWQTVRGATVNVDVGSGGSRFSPADITINVGDTVRWIRRSSGHDVNSPGNFASSLPMGAEFTHTFNSPGTFNYFCTPHASIGMVGVVRVIAAPVNQLPTVNITSPANGATFTTTDQITITATATDTDGTVSQVQFFDGNNPIGTVTTAPYLVTVSLAEGSHTLTARATDNVGGVGISPGVTVTVNPPANQPPNVTITSPANGATFTTGQQVTITADAGDPDGGISQVQFFNHGSLLGSDNQAPYEFTFTPTAGDHSLTARATDNEGASADSEPVAITVTGPANQLPTVSFTAPAENAVIAEGDSVTFQVNASDPEGQLDRVEFSIGGSVVGTDNSAPYEFSSTTLALGGNTVTAVAFDTQGGQSEPGSVNVNVVTMPQITSITRVSPTEVRIAATGTSGVPHTLQFSSDLQTWNDGPAASPSRGNVTLTDNPPEETQRRFYRIAVK